MRSIIEQVDEFIESYFDGTIISTISDVIIGHEVKIPSKTLKERVSEDLSSLVSILIPNYLKVQDGEKEKLAETIYNIVIQLRTFVMVRNNPLSLRELDYFKSRCQKLEDDNNGLIKRIVELSDTVQKLTAGSSAIR